MVMTKNALFMGLDMTAKEVEKRVRKIRSQTNNRPVAKDVLATRAQINRMGRSVNREISEPRPPRSSRIRFISTNQKLLTD